MASERERLERRKFLREFEKEEAELAERLERPLKLKRLQEELNRNSQKLMRVRRQQVMGFEEHPYIPDDLYYLTFDSQEQFEEWSRAEARAFFEECHPLGWSGKPEHVQTLMDYFSNRGISLIDRRMYKAAWLSLRKDGLFDEPESVVPAPAPVALPIPEPKEEEESFESLPRLPLGHQTPVSYRRETQETYQGIDANTGRQREYTQLEVDRMDSETYRKVFNVPTPALTRVNFLK
jgi:hypothetical protein